jgi:NAD(P)-dependent dehydrogenase (short-subunit alcohol dehydrogenase family)
MTCEFEGKNYIVTGASSGIGREVCIELSRRKAAVVLIARNEERTNETLSMMDPANHSAIIHDLADISGINGIAENIRSQYGKVDGIVYSAGVAPVSPLHKTTCELLHSVMLVNFYAFMELVRCVIRHNPGKHPMRVVAMSAATCRDMASHLSAYAASKAAVEAAVRCLSVELHKKNITINTVCPAHVRTPMQQSAVYDDMDEQIKKSGKQPLGLIDPADVAKMAVYLMSDAAKYITGMSIPINGGMRYT